MADYLAHTNVCYLTLSNLKKLQIIFDITKFYYIIIDNEIFCPFQYTYDPTLYNLDNLQF